MKKPTLVSELTLFDVTNLVVGAIIGADIYVASSFGAGLIGPASLLAWAIAGIFAIVLALCFAQSAALLPRVGGPYAYARHAWGSFVGFMVGWSLWLAEWLSLAVFPVAFTRYLMFFFTDLGVPLQILVKILFVLFLIVTNVVGVKAAGRTNDMLTIIKLSPLVFFIVAGLVVILLNPSNAASNLSPFDPLGFTGFGAAFILIFWAYAGFEISTIPADEIKDPGKTIPRAIILGMTIVTFFYLVTNLILFSVRRWSDLAYDLAPLATASTSMLGTTGLLAIIAGLIVGIGALFSVAGSDESGMVGTSRIGYALAVDGLFPSYFARVHKKYRTPYIAIIIQGATALAVAIVGGFYIYGLNVLISTSVFFMAIAYAATSASIFSLRKEQKSPKFRLRGGLLIPTLGVIFSLILIVYPILSFFFISQTSLYQILLGLLLLGIGIPIYLKLTPKKELSGLKESFFSREMILRRMRRQESRFLAHALLHIKRLYRRLTGRENVHDEVHEV